MLNMNGSTNKKNIKIEIWKKELGLNFKKLSIIQITEKQILIW